MIKAPFTPGKVLFILVFVFCLRSTALAGETFTLADAAMCEGIREYSPENISVVFSASLKKISCFTSFDPVTQKSAVYHRWFHKDSLTTTKKLYLSPPRWATFSSIQPRNSDKGPWRVEITDKSGKIYRTLRFSITD